MATGNSLPSLEVGPAAALLSAAKIVDLPQSFDGAALMHDLNSMLLRYQIECVGQTTGAVKSDVVALYEIRNRTRALAKDIAAILENSPRMRAHHALLDIGAINVLQLLDDLRALESALPAEIERLRKLATGERLLPGDGASAVQKLFGRLLPDVYTKHFLHACGVSEHSGIGDEATECVRFMMAANDAMGLGKISAAAVVKNAKRWKAATSRDNAHRK
jgi:hypothetical protein